MTIIKKTVLALAAAGSMLVAFAPAQAGWHRHHPVCHIERHHHHAVRVCR